MKPIYLILLALLLCISASSAATITTALNVTVTSSQAGPWMVGNSSYNQTLTLPDAGLTNFPGKEFAFTIKVNPGTNWVRIVGTGGDTIGGAAIFATSDYPANVVVYSDGTNWQVKSYKGLWYKDGVAETLDWSGVTTTQTFPTDLAMGANDITGAGNVNATAVYSGGELQRNQANPDYTVWMNSTHTIAENSFGTYVDAHPINTNDEGVIQTAMTNAHGTVLIKRGSVPYVVSPVFAGFTMKDDLIVRGESTKTEIRISTGKVFLYDGVSRSSVRDLTINVTSAASDVFYFVTENGFICDNVVDNVIITSTGDRTYRGMLIDISNAQGRFTRNHLSNILMLNPGTGIYLSVSGTEGGWIGGNQFKNIMISNPIIGVDHSLGSGASATCIQNNVFDAVVVQTGDRTTYGFKEIGGLGERFTACPVYDWETADSPVYAYHFSTQWRCPAKYCVLNGGSYSGKSTVYVSSLTEDLDITSLFGAIHITDLGIRTRFSAVGFGQGITTASNISVYARPDITYFVGNASNNQTITLPDAAISSVIGVPFSFVVNTDPGSYYFRLTATGADHIGGNDYYIITETGTVNVISDGTDYHIQSHEGTWIAAGA